MSEGPIKKRINMAKNLLQRLKQRQVSLLSFVVFGSTARGKPRENSDVDILIIVKEKDKRMWRTLLEESGNIEGLYGPFFSFIFTTEEKLRENPLILLDMTEECIILYDPGKVFCRLVEKFKEVIRNLGSKRIWLDEWTWYWEIKPDWKPGEEVEIRL